MAARKKATGKKGGNGSKNPRPRARKGARQRKRKVALPSWLSKIEGDRRYGWAIKAWDRAAAVPGAWFDHDKAQAVVDCWPLIFRLTDDRFAGDSFHLLLWQEIIVRLLFGWKAPVEIKDPKTGEKAYKHVRLFRRLLLWIARKNGKSEFLAALALAFYSLDGIAGGQGYCFARNEEQAEVPFEKMKAMVQLNARLAKEIQVNKKSLWTPKIRAGFKLLTGGELGKMGKGPTVILGDEMHEWKSRDIENTLRQGTGTRLEPIELYASTAGLKTNPVGIELWDESQKILDGTIEDPATLVAVFALDPEMDWEDEENWEHANPSLGITPTIGNLRREAKLAKNNPRAEAHFKCYHLNIWVDGVTRWLNMRAWADCASSETAWKKKAEKFADRPCFGAFDVSIWVDITALVWLFPPTAEDPHYRLLCRFWCPEDTIQERVKQDRVPYDKFVAAGALETTQGNYVDQDAIFNAVLEGVSLFDVQRIGFDSWQARKLASDLEKEIGEEDMFVEVRQGIRTLAEPTKEFERLVYAGLIDHGAHPVLDWMAANTAVRFDENLNFAPAKKKSKEKIDGIVATIMALAVSKMDVEDDGSVYEDRGIAMV